MCAGEDFLVEAPKDVGELVLGERRVGAFQVFFVGLSGLLRGLVGFEKFITELVSDLDAEIEATLADLLFEFEHFLIEDFFAARFEGFSDGLPNVDHALHADLSELDWVAHTDELEGGFQELADL